MRPWVDRFPFYHHITHCFNSVNACYRAVLHKATLGTEGDSKMTQYCYYSQGDYGSRREINSKLLYKLRWKRHMAEVQTKVQEAQIKL